jgi:radical SAM protein with 4Fe4S-binding SPASM domain
MKGISNRFQLFNDYVGKREIVSGFPVELGIELTNHCNLKCPFCAREEMTRAEGQMPFELFTKIVDEIKGYAELIYLHGDGEPLIHKRVFDAIRYARKNGIRVGMSTNATLLTEDRARQLIDSGIDYLIIAMDGITKETYEKLRVKGDFDEVKRNVERYLTLSREKKSKTFNLVQIIEMNENRHEVDEFYRYWKKFHPSVVRIKGLTDLIWKESKAKFRGACFYIWRSAMIDWDGTVFPCCVDTNSTQRLGNVNQQSFAECWNSPVMTGLRKKHAAGQQAEIAICKTCDMHQFSLAEAFGVTLLGGVTSKKLLPFVENLTYLYKTVFERKFRSHQKHEPLESGTRPPPVGI